MNNKLKNLFKAIGIVTVTITTLFILRFLLEMLYNYSVIIIFTILMIISMFLIYFIWKVLENKK